jgi:hypothetical protein
LPTRPFSVIQKKNCVDRTFEKKSDKTHDKIKIIKNNNNNDNNNKLGKGREVSKLLGLDCWEGLYSLIRVR